MAPTSRLWVFARFPMSLAWVQTAFHFSATEINAVPSGVKVMARTPFAGKTGSIPAPAQGLNPPAQRRLGDIDFAPPS